MRAGEEIRTTCGECLAACGVLVAPDGRVRGDDDHPISRGYLCQNGKASGALVAHPGRLVRPRVHGRDADWATALDRAESGIRAALAAGGPQAVGLYFGAGDPAGSLAFLAASGFLQGLGSTRHYNVIGLEATHRFVVGREMFGDPLVVPRPDLEAASGLLLLGTNPVVSNDECGVAEGLAELRRRRGVTVVLDPRKTEVARHASVHLALRPGTDAEVLLALLHVLFAERLVAPEPPVPLDGVLALRRLAEEWPPERAAALADVRAGDIVRAARLLGRARPVATLTRLGTAMSRRASVNEWLAYAVVGVLGGLGARGGQLLNPGFLDFHAMMKRSKQDPAAIVGVLPPARMADDILADAADQVRALVVVAADPVESVPNAAKVARALRRLDTLVVLDVVPTATTELATVTLPCAHHLEKEDVYLLLPDRVPRAYTQLARPVAPPPGEARSEVAIFAELARRLGTPLFGAPAIDWAVRLASLRDRERPMSPEGALRVLLPLLTRFQLTRRKIGARGGHAPGPAAGRLDPATFRAAITRPGGHIDVAPPALVAEARRSLAAPAHPADELVLTTCGRARGFINGKLRVIGRGADGIVVHLAPAEAERRGLAEGAAVLLETRTGREPATVAIDPELRAGVAAVVFGSPGLNRLTDDDDRDPLSGIPAMANVPCRLTPIARGGGEA
jgi:formate dehydrogenase